MAVKVIVFDFDGTLVDSNQLKYDAFFSLFSGNNELQKIVQKVLDKYREESRYVILEKILKKYGISNEDEISVKVQELAEQYNSIVLEGVKHCNQRAGAKELLRLLATDYDLYLSSVTPEVALREIVKYRGWDGFFKGVYGYPKNKADTLKRIMEKEALSQDEIIVVGDGTSDELSAKTVGCRFFPVKQDTRLSELFEGNILSN